MYLDSETRGGRFIDIFDTAVRPWASGLYSSLSLPLSSRLSLSHPLSHSHTRYDFPHLSLVSSAMALRRLLALTALFPRSAIQLHPRSATATAR